MTRHVIAEQRTEYRALDPANGFTLCVCSDATDAYDEVAARMIMRSGSRRWGRICEAGDLYQERLRFRLARCLQFLDSRQPDDGQQQQTKRKADQ